MTFTSLHADDVAIDRLKVKTPSGGGIGRVAHELILAQWPKARDGGWVFIRQVHARAPRSRLAAAVSARVRSVMDSARSGIDNGVAIRFSSLPELLARFLTDLVHGRASRQWYWQHWAHLFPLPPGRAAATLMESFIDHLPAVTAELARTGSLSRIWLELGRQDAVRLTATVIGRSGLHLPRISGDATDTEPQLAPLEVPAPIKARWAETLKALPEGDQRRTLALVLVGQENFPLLMLEAPARLLRAVGRAFEAPESRPERTRQTAPGHLHASDSPATGNGDMVTPARSEPMRTSAADNGRPSEHPIASPPGSSSRMEPAEEGHRPSREGTGALEGRGAILVEADPGASADVGRTAPHEPAPEKRSPGGAQTDKQPRSSALSTPEIQTDAESMRLRERVRLAPAQAQGPFDLFSTGQGGLFFLLNFLKREDAQVLIRQKQPPGGFVSGWGWLYRLGQELGLDENDPVVGFLARQMGLEGIDQLAALPLLPAREQLMALAVRLYDRTGLWRPQLLRLDARVKFTPSHVDLYAPLDSVRLPVRLAGLDLDPGWLPWLGRVVTFHYEP